MESTDICIPVCDGTGNASLQISFCCWLAGSWRRAATICRRVKTALSLPVQKAGESLQPLCLLPKDWPAGQISLYGFQGILRFLQKLSVHLGGTCHCLWWKINPQNFFKWFYPTQYCLQCQHFLKPLNVWERDSKYEPSVFHLNYPTEHRRNTQNSQNQY